MKSKAVTPSPVLEEQIPGLRDALAAERRAEQALDDVRTRREAAQYAHATARAYRSALQERAAQGSPIPASELVEATRAIDEAAAALEEFPPLVAIAEKNFSRAAGEVTSTLKSELRKQAADAREAAIAAEAAFNAAAAVRIARLDEAAAALRTIEHSTPDSLRSMFAEEIAASEPT